MIFAPKKLYKQTPTKQLRRRLLYQKGYGKASGLYPSSSLHVQLTNVGKLHNIRPSLFCWCGQSEVDK